MCNSINHVNESDRPNSQCHCESGCHGESGKKEIVKLTVGAGFFAAGVIISLIAEINPLIAPIVFIVSYIILGGDVVLSAFGNITRGKVFDENFLMSTATIGAFFIGEYPEAVAVMLFYQIGEYFQGTAVSKSKKSIAALMDIRPDSANLIADGKTVKVSPRCVNIGDLIVVKPGEKVPLDGVVIKGESSLDVSALTGESVPRKVSALDAVMSGCINKNGVLTVKVSESFETSTASKIIELVENAAGKKAPAENFITAFAKYYTPAVVLLAAAIAVIPPLLAGGLWVDWINRGLIFLVISCPCALVISIPLSFFGGIGCASKKGVLVKGGNYLDALNSLDTVVFDKTGTLTKGEFNVTGVKPHNGFTQSSLLETAAKAETFSNHPIALSVLNAYGKSVDKALISEYNEIAGQGVSVKSGGKTILAGSYSLMVSRGVNCDERSETGTKVYVAVDGVFAGCVIISDEIKSDAHKAVGLLKKAGVRKIAMLTGDEPRVAKAVAAKLGIDEVYGGLLPHQKVEKLEALNNKKLPRGKLAFIGDGINDAPVLAMADIGIAMGGLGSDAAVEAADIVLMTDEPSKLCEAVKVAGFTRRVARQNIVFALSVKAVFLLLGAFGVASMWEAVFADVGVSLIAVVNAMRVMRA